MTSLLHTLHQWTGLPTPFSTSTSTSTSINTQPVGPERVGPLWQQLLDDDRLSDACWNAEMRTVEVWENERWAGVPPPTSPGIGGDTFEMPSNHSANTNTNATGTGGWSKANLKPGERGAWTRGRDGWSAVGVASGEVSNLTFALGPGWEFVPSEGWRRDARGAWSTCGADRDGWVYTNDAWMDARAVPAGRGTAPVTRRRRQWGVMHFTLDGIYYFTHNSLCPSHRYFQVNPWRKESLALYDDNTPAAHPRKYAPARRSGLPPGTGTGSHSLEAQT
ncbi:hypothetical protein BD779DRAFT_1470830 [Infundibulicybe gibba]|nr:hypothetical protein BD779DRAFT_1470830 [Infundibulicybe gibba]